MKRRALLSHLRRHGCELLRQGKKHSIYWHPANRKTSSIPTIIYLHRHNEIDPKKWLVLVGAAVPGPLSLAGTEARPTESYFHIKKFRDIR